MFERFTARARRTLVLAQEEARTLGHPFIGTEHILLGLMAEGEGVGAKALAFFDVSLEQLRVRIVEVVPAAGDADTRKKKAPFTPRAKKVLELSLREALSLGHNYIGTEHLLLGILRDGEGVAAQVLSASGVTADRGRAIVLKMLQGAGGGPIVEYSDPAGRVRQRPGTEGGESVPLDRLSPAVRSAITTILRFYEEVRAKEPERQPQLVTSGQLIMQLLGDRTSHLSKVADIVGLDRDRLFEAIIDTPEDGTSDEAPGARQVSVELPDSATASAVRGLTPDEVGEAIRRFLADRDQGDGPDSATT